MLRCLQIGLSINDLDLLSVGLVNDMYTEKMNDTCEGAYAEMATQEDFDKF